MSFVPHISFLPLSIHNSFLFQSKFFDDGIITRLCQIVFGGLPKFDLKREKFSDC